MSNAFSVLGLESNATWLDVRATFLKVALESHPDKPNGDSETFLRIRSAFEAIKASHDANAPLNQAIVDEKNGTHHTNLPELDIYKAAEGIRVPRYKFERATSARSKCVAKDCKNRTIGKGDVRVSLLNTATGTYGNSSHILCSKVPNSVHLLGLRKRTNETVEIAFENMEFDLFITGFLGLDAAAKNEVVEHVLKTGQHDENYTHETDGPTDLGGAQVAEAGFQTPTNPSLRTVSAPDAPKKIPKENLLAKKADGVVAGQLSGKKFVLTGVFTHSGFGGVGLKRGKDGAKEWLETHGAKVVTSISKNTDFVVIGELPGAAKLEAAKKANVVFTTLETLSAGILAQNLMQIIEENPVEIGQLKLSAGFGGNGARRRLCGEQEQCDDQQSKRLKFCD